MNPNILISLLLSLSSLFWYAYKYPNDLLFALGISSVFVWMSLVSLLQTDLDYKGRERHTVGMALLTHLRLIKAIKIIGVIVMFSYLLLGNKYIKASDLWNGNLREEQIILGAFYFLLTGLSAFYTLVFSFFDLRHILLGQNPYNKDFDLKYKKYIGFFLLFSPFALIMLLSLLNE